MDTFALDLANPQAIFLCIFAYGLGSVPFGLLLSNWFKKIDPRKVGSGNIGATNVTRAAGLRLGLLTFFLDMAKGAFPVLMAWSLQFSLETQAVVGLCAFLGHCFPIWLLFRGGKGVATGLGVILILSPILAGMSLFAFSLGYGIGKQVAVGSVLAAAVVFGGSFFLVSNGFVASILVIMGLVIILRHQNNIRRLLNKKEG